MPRKKKQSHEEPQGESIAAAEEVVVYSFDHGRRCPRCQSVDTVARSTQGHVQYRRCVRAVCMHRYAVVGKEI